MTETHNPDRAPRSHAREHAQTVERELIMFLERDQLVLDKSQPVPRATLGSRASVALWALRVYAGAIGAMVIYTFISQAAS